MGILEAVGHIRWTIERSPRAYAEARNMLIDLRIALVNAELKYLDKQNATRRRKNAVNIA